MNFRRQDVGERPTASPESSGKNRACPHTARARFRSHTPHHTHSEEFRTAGAGCLSGPQSGEPEEPSPQTYTPKNDLQRQGLERLPPNSPTKCPPIEGWPPPSLGRRQDRKSV